LRSRCSSATIVTRHCCRGRMLLEVSRHPAVRGPRRGLRVAVAVLLRYFLPLPIYGTIWMLLSAYCVFSHSIPFGVRAASAGLRHIGPELEEARITAPPGSALLRRIVITARCSSPPSTVGWILVFTRSVRALSLSILLYSQRQHRRAGRHLAWYRPAPTRRVPPPVVCRPSWCSPPSTAPRRSAAGELLQLK